MNHDDVAGGLSISIWTNVNEKKNILKTQTKELLGGLESYQIQ